MRTRFYTLFISEAHSTIRFDYLHSTIEKFRALWDAGKSMKDICLELDIEYTEFMLIALDLNYIDALAIRKNGLFGQ